MGVKIARVRCPRCKEEWTPRVEEPIQCPSCHADLRRLGGVEEVEESEPPAPVSRKRPPRAG